MTTPIPLIRKRGRPRMEASADTRPKLTGAATCLRWFVIRHVEQIIQVRLL